MPFMLVAIATALGFLGMRMPWVFPIVGTYAASGVNYALAAVNNTRQFISVCLRWIFWLVFWWIALLGFGIWADNSTFILFLLIVGGLTTMISTLALFAARHGVAAAANAIETLANTIATWFINPARITGAWQAAAVLPYGLYLLAIGLPLRATAEILRAIARARNTAVTWIEAMANILAGISLLLWSLAVFTLFQIRHNLHVLTPENYALIALASCIGICLFFFGTRTSINITAIVTAIAGMAILLIGTMVMGNIFPHQSEALSQIMKNHSDVLTKRMWGESENGMVTPQLYYRTTKETKIRWCENCKVENGKFIPVNPLHKMTYHDEGVVKADALFMAPSETSRPVELNGVLFRPVYKAKTEDITDGFDDTKLYLVYHNHLRDEIRPYEEPQTDAPIVSFTNIAVFGSIVIIGLLILLTKWNVLSPAARAVLTVVIALIILGGIFTVNYVALRALPLTYLFIAIAVLAILTWLLYENLPANPAWIKPVVLAVMIIVLATLVAQTGMAAMSRSDNGSIFPGTSAAKTGTTTPNVCAGSGVAYSELSTPKPQRPEKIGPNKWKMVIVADRENISLIPIKSGQTLTVESITGEVKLFGCDRFTNPPQGRYPASSLTSPNPKAEEFILQDTYAGALLARIVSAKNYTDISGRDGQNQFVFDIVGADEGFLSFVVNARKNEVGNATGSYELVFTIE